MRVRLTVTVEVDPHVWATVYGPNDGVRKDVREYVETQIRGSAAANEGAITDVSVRATHTTGSTS